MVWSLVDNVSPAPFFADPGLSARFSCRSRSGSAKKTSRAEWFSRGFKASIVTRSTYCSNLTSTACRLSTCLSCLGHHNLFQNHLLQEKVTELCQVNETLSRSYVQSLMDKAQHSLKSREPTNGTGRQEDQLLSYWSQVSKRVLKRCRFILEKTNDTGKVEMKLSLAKMEVKWLPVALSCPLSNMTQLRYDRSFKRGWPKYSHYWVLGIILFILVPTHSYGHHT